MGLKQTVETKSMTNFDEKMYKHQFRVYRFPVVVDFVTVGNVYEERGEKPRGQNNFQRRVESHDPVIVVDERVGLTGNQKHASDVGRTATVSVLHRPRYTHSGLFNLRLFVSFLPLATSFETMVVNVYCSTGRLRTTRNHRPGRFIFTER